MTNMESFKIIEPREIDFNAEDFIGDYINTIHRKTKNVISHQLFKNIKNSPIKGFLFYGDVGLGKTALAKAIAKELGISLIFIDGSDIARGRYGDSEQQIKNIFRKANEHEKVIILFDDIDCFLMSRDASISKEWHYAINATFFHEIDNMDTSKIFVILTTNRFDLVDKAIIDRFYPIEFPIPDEKTFFEIAKSKCERFDYGQKLTDKILRRVQVSKIKSVRQIEKIIIEEYISSLSG